MDSLSLVALPRLAGQGRRTVRSVRRPEAATTAAASAARPARRRLLLGLMVALLLATSAAALGPVADAGAAGPIKSKYDIQVYESNYDVNTGIDVAPGETVRVRCEGTIWAGVLLTGRNGPDGWVGYHAGSDYPLPNAWSYSLLGKLNNRYYYNGSSHDQVQYSATSRLYLRINDNVPGNGNGYFSCDVEVYAG
jgi:hypothetical protein